MDPTPENLAVASLTVLALALFVVALRAWSHARSVKVLLLGVGFGFFLAKGVMLSVGLFRVPAWQEALTLPGILLDLAAMGAFYAAVLKRAGP